MSSMRNAVYRRQHRERGQLEGREKWGILEKHKDYSLRARDYNMKKAKLQRLREKARDRNPDEFAFGMLNARTAKQGRHGARDTVPLSQDAVKLLKTQDAGYLRVVGDRIRREMERLEKDVQLQESMQKVLGTGNQHRSDDDDEDEDDDMEGNTGGKSRKIVFADSREEQRKLGRLRDDSDDDDDDDDDVEDEEDFSFEQQQKQQQQQNDQQQAKKSKKQLEAERRAFLELRAANRLKRRAAEVRRNRLKALKKQHAEITAAEKELDWQRGKMDHSVGGVNKYGVKWKVRERKR
ncbi:hypothetical protein VTN77DRAFT_9417 [Rasamsonia byssochlamydoides]|uniref:uncharacterized protein n=1 Tax=Rasamsonia byssochlamydoides TaxID=89139 RepID=UPI0037443023